MFRNFKQQIPFLLLVLFFYTLAYPVINALPVDDLLRKSLYVHNILFYSPLVTFLLSLLYAGIYGFSWQFSIWTGILFLGTIPVFGEWIWDYQLLYLFFSFLGNALGAGIHGWRKR